MDREQVQQEVARLAGAWIAAEARGDTAFLERTLADDFVAVGPRGFLLTKREWIGRHESGNLTYLSLDLDEVTVRVYEGAAVLIGRQVQDLRFRGNKVEETQLRTTAVLIGQPGHWQLTGLHLSAISQPPSLAQQPPAVSP